MRGAVCDGRLGAVGDGLGGRGWLWCGGVAGKRVTDEALLAETT